MNSRDLLKSKEREILACVEAGMGIKPLAREFKVTYSTMRHFLECNGWKKTTGRKAVEAKRQETAQITWGKILGTDKLLEALNKATIKSQKKLIIGHCHINKRA